MSEDQRLLEYLKRVTVDLHDARGRLREVEDQVHEPIAIIGMGCRYPGGINTSEDLWNVVSGGVDAICKFPTDRGWDLKNLIHPDPDHHKTTHVDEGGFVYSASEFDAEFFGISPREARTMDPQQRLMLETCWHAFEDAKLDPTSMQGSDIGVFAGLMYHEYATARKAAAGEMEGYFGTGASGSVLSGRVSYAFGLEGPAITVDTACSSSLVAVHMGTEALRKGECSLALAGGVTVLSSPVIFIELSRQHGLSDDGRCRSFADEAEGAAFAEGVGVLLMERLSDAQRNGHRVLGVVRGSAVNQDGASNGLTAPNGPSQERVIRRALSRARLTPSDVDMVEGHGTATMLGDPIEAQALLATYGRERRDGEPLRLGSIKSNFGHAQAAAGVAGVIKVVKALEHGLMPKTLHVEKPSRNVDWSSGAVELLKDGVAWTAGERPRRGAVSSFGISGTNAHMIIEEAPRELVEQPQADGEQPPTDTQEGAEAQGEEQAQAERLPLGDGSTVAWVFSGRGPTGLRSQAQSLREFVESESQLDFEGVGEELTHRARLSHRGVVVGSQSDQLIVGLDAVAQSSTAANAVTGVAKSKRGTVFVFSGQGGQWDGMALELLRTSPVFAAEMQRCEQALNEIVDWSLLDVLAKGDGAPDMESLNVLQPVLFSVMVSLAAMWRACGVEPAAVVGHSQGEIAAAYVAGGLSLSDALRLVTLRSGLLSRLAGKGSIVSVAAGEQEVQQRIARFEGRLSIASVNGPSAVGVAGDPESLRELLLELEADGVRAREIASTVASHSDQVESLHDETIELLSRIEPRSSKIAFYSTVTGEQLDTAQLDAEYWYENMRRPVRFEQVAHTLLAGSHRVFVEVGPHPVLSVPLQETIDDQLGEQDDAVVVGSLLRGQGGLDRMLISMAQLWVDGVEVDWGAVFVPGESSTGPRAPLYAFNRARYWLEDMVAEATDPITVGQRSTRHPFLITAVELAGNEGLLLTGKLIKSRQRWRWLGENSLGQVQMAPDSVLLELALCAATQADCDGIRELTLEAPLIFPQEGDVHLQVKVGPRTADGRCEIGIYSRPEEAEEEQSQSDWIRHASGALSADGALAAGPVDVKAARQAAWPPEGAEPLEVEEIYDRLAKLGLDLGPTLQGVRVAWRLDQEVLLEATLGDEGVDASTFCLHPVLMAAALHPLTADSESLRSAHVWSDISLAATGSSFLRVRLSLAEGDTIQISAADEDGVPVLSGSLTMRELSAESLAKAGIATRNRSLFSLDWSPITIAPRLHETLHVIGDKHGTLARTLGGAGFEVQTHDDLDSLAQSQMSQASGSNGTGSLDLQAGRVVLLEADVVDDDGDTLERAYATAHRALRFVQQWLSDERFSAARLAVVTQNAVAVAPGESVDGLSQSVAWGLVRTAQSESMGRLQLLDVDGSEASWRGLPALCASEEPQIALREGEALIPSMTTMDLTGRSEAVLLDPDRTVLITGGLTGLGALTARHLVEQHGVRSLLLTSRRGMGTEGARELQSELEALGAGVLIEACDVSDRAQVAAVLENVPAERPLGAVVHAAAVIDDGLIDSLTDERLDAVLAPKANGAWHLHELTQGLELSAFVMFSSIAGVLGSPGQANYAAANNFLDALAAYRRGRGERASSIAWGRWAQESDLSGGLSTEQLNRLRRGGIEALSSEEGLELLDLASDPHAGALSISARFDFGVLRALAREGLTAPLLRGLVRTSARRLGEATGGTLLKRLERVQPQDRETFMLDYIRGEVATVLGFDNREELDPESTFKDLGFDSLGALDLRNRLNVATNLRLPATLVFNYPTPVALATFLLSQLDVMDLQPGSLADSIEQLERALGESELDGGEGAKLAARLRTIAANLQEADPGERPVDDEIDRIEAASAEELFELAEREWATDVTAGAVDNSDGNGAT